ncbi:unnamed protein product [Cylicocyclus nassatus]|uniref:Uncharacterized protein n=1 Tax=Cylicocyclus nassatus TaxID=53992 RepID=A0AA36HDX9_CYLNA|nr:unnamed protein product [Cylicocyclus nassatus]
MPLIVSRRENGESYPHTAKYAPSPLISDLSTDSLESISLYECSRKWNGFLMGRRFFSFLKEMILLSIMTMWNK